MDSRAQFEEYFEYAYGWEVSDYPNQTYVQEVWEMWQASRASIEVELPEKISPHNTNESGYVIGQAAMYDESIDDCAEAIRYVGISIKGDKK